jgi:hypothetical protein
MNPVVIVSKNHPSSPKEAPSLYEEEEDEEDGQSSRDRKYRAEDALRGAEISQHRDRQWRIEEDDLSRGKGSTATSRDGVRNQRLTPPYPLLFRSLLVPSFLRVHLLNSLFFEKIKVICFSNGVASHQS